MYQHDQYIIIIIIIIMQFSLQEVEKLQQRTVEIRTPPFQKE